MESGEFVKFIRCKFHYPFRTMQNKMIKELLCVSTSNKNLFIYSYKNMVTKQSSYSFTLAKTIQD